MTLKERWEEYVASEAFVNASDSVRTGGETLHRQERYVNASVKLSRKNLTTPFSC